LQFPLQEIGSDWQKSLSIKFVGIFINLNVEMKVSLHLTIRGTWKLFHVFLPVSYSFHIKIYESCAYDHPQLRSFWLDKVSKYHIDSLAKLIVQMPPLLNSTQLCVRELDSFGCFPVFILPVKGGLSWVKVVSCGLSFIAPSHVRTWADTG